MLLTLFKLRFNINRDKSTGARPTSGGLQVTPIFYTDRCYPVQQRWCLKAFLRGFDMVVLQVIERHKVNIFIPRQQPFAVAARTVIICWTTWPFPSLQILGSVGEPINEEAWNGKKKHRQRKTPGYRHVVVNGNGWLLAISPIANVTNQARTLSFRCPEFKSRNGWERTHDYRVHWRKGLIKFRSGYGADNLWQSPAL